MDIMKFITEQALIMVAVLYVIGMFIKNLDFVKDKYTPFILLVISLGFTPSILGGYNDPQSYIQAVLVTGGAVLTNQLIKQAKKGE